MYLRVIQELIGTDYKLTLKSLKKNVKLLGDMIGSFTGNKKFSWSATEEKRVGPRWSAKAPRSAFLPLCGIAWWLGNSSLCMAVPFCSLKII